MGIKAAIALMHRALLNQAFDEVGTYLPGKRRGNARRNGIVDYAIHNDFVFASDKGLSGRLAR